MDHSLNPGSIWYMDFKLFQGSCSPESCPRDFDRASACGFGCFRLARQLGRRRRIFRDLKLQGLRESAAISAVP